MSTDYKYKLADCDVTDRRALESYRAKRATWLSWINADEHHAIWDVLSGMVWTDVSFRALTQFAIDAENSALHNTLLTEALIGGHVATQVLAIRRLVDNRGDDVISLRKLIKDIRSHFGLFTRENYVCFDGLPYDYEAVQLKDMPNRVGKGFFWGATEGPEAYGTSRMGHEQFDKLAGIDTAKRCRTDRLPVSLLDTIEKWVEDSGAGELAKWSHAYLAHAGGPTKRDIEAQFVTTNKIRDSIKALVRVTEAISAWLLWSGGRSGSLMPTAQFNPFEKLDNPIMRAGSQDDAYKLWHQLSDDSNHYLDGVEEELIQRVKAAP
jgi:hypothetical protein